MEITPPRVWRRRRDWLRAGLSTMVGGVGLGPAGRASARPADQAEASATAGSGARQRLPARMGDAAFQTMEKPTAAGDVTSYNNFYEFGTDKRDPQRHASRMVVRPWTVSVEGLVRRPRVFDLDELLSLAPMEERVYRLRCVEGWSMVIPWIGYSLAELIRRVEPLGDAKFIEYQTLADRRQMPGLDYPVLDWPYTEGLRLDEAMHPLTLLTFGMYGEVLPNQNGAPVRVIVPWKYGFKSGKSIVRIRFTDRQPMTTWHQHAPRVYGFYANVNPEVDHPRWSQASERRIGDDGLFARKRRTLMFNGYADQVASLYQGMDLTRHI